MKYIIGIDGGTTNIKAVIFDENGNEVSTEVIENEPLYVTDSNVEMDMDELWSKTLKCLKNLISNNSSIKDDIVGIGITGQGEGLWLLDENGKTLQNAILWCDARSKLEVDEFIKEKPEIGKLIHDKTGSPPLLGTQLMILKWMSNNRKEILDKAKYSLFCKDWLRYKLTNKIGTDITDSGTSLVDINTGKIADDILEKIGLSKYTKILPQPSESDELAGDITDEVKKDIGLNKNISVTYGAIDVSAAALGTGAIHYNDICVILGTTCANEIIISKNNCNFGEANTRFIRHPLRDLYIYLNPTMNGTPNFDWAIENISITKDYKEIDALIEKEPVGSRGVIYHPYLSVAGERAPFYHPYARASFFGISQPVKRETLLRAVIEGITFSIKDCLANIEKDSKIFLAGGGANSSVWAQIISDCVGVPVYIPDAKELGAKGAALMTAVRLGVYKNYEEAVEKACHFKEIYYPKENNVKKYNLLFTLYKELREINMELWNKRHSITKQLKLLD